MSAYPVSAEALDAADQAAAKHKFTSISRPRDGGRVEHVAGCTCGVTLEWAKRFQEHAAHIDRVRLAAAAPLLCPPLADEVERLRGIVEAVDKGVEAVVADARSEWSRLFPTGQVIHPLEAVLAALSSSVPPVEASEEGR